jgi:hypothetical protein
MKGFIRKAVLAACGAAGALGCYGYRDLVDVCYPVRYNYMAREEVNGALAPQVQNGHVLDQTIWNYFFEPGTDRLTPLGLDRLAYLARRRPCPDPNLWLQTAQDIIYDSAAPEKMAEAREELDKKRINAVTCFLVQQTAGRPMAFHIVVHDPAEAGLSAVPVNLSVLQMYYRFRGGLISGGNVTGGGGAGGGMGGAGAGIQGAPAGMGGGMGGR